MTDHIHRVTAAGDTVDIDVDVASAGGHIMLDLHVEVTPAPPALPPPPSTVDLLVAKIGDSGAKGYATGASADPGFLVGVPNEDVQFHARYADAIGPPPEFFDFPAPGILGPLALYDDPSALSMGSEMSLGPTLLSAVARPCLIKACTIPGTTLAIDWLPTGMSPAASDGNLYHLSRAQIRVFEAQVGRALDALIIEVGTNDGASADQASAFQPNATALIAQARTDFPGVAIVLIRPNPNVPNAHMDLVIATVNAIAAADPTVRVVDTDDLPLATSAHATANGYLSQGQREGFAVIDARGLSRQDPSELTVVGWGPEVHGTGDLTAIPWAGSMPGDLEAMPVVVGLSAPGTITPDASWTFQSDSGIASAIGVHANMVVFTREVTAELLAGRKWTPAASVTIAGTTRNAAKIFTVRGPMPAPTVRVGAQGFASSVYGPGPTTIPDAAGTGLRLWFTGGFSGQDPLSTLSIAGVAVRKVQDSACNILTDRMVITLHTSTDPGPATMTSTESLLVTSNTLVITP